MEAAREGAGFGGPSGTAVAALEGIGAEGGEAEIVDAATQAVKGLADAKAEAASAAGEAVELGVEVGDGGMWASEMRVGAVACRERLGVVAVGRGSEARECVVVTCSKSRDGLGVFLCWGEWDALGVSAWRGYGKRVEQGALGCGGRWASECGFGVRACWAKGRQMRVLGFGWRWAGLRGCGRGGGWAEPG